MRSSSLVIVVWLVAAPLAPAHGFPVVERGPRPGVLGRVTEGLRRFADRLFARDGYLRLNDASARRPVRRELRRRLDALEQARPEARQNPVLSARWKDLRRVDALLLAFDALGMDKRVTGGTVRDTLGARQRLAAGTSQAGPRLDDLDLGLDVSSAVERTRAAMRQRPPLFARRRSPEQIDRLAVERVVAEVIRTVRAHFPEVRARGRITRKPSYRPGVVHVQFETRGADGRAMQLDCSLYTQRGAYRRPHQYISVAKLKLAVPPGARLTDLLHELTDFEAARRMPELKDPAEGTRDLMANVLAVRRERTQSPRLTTPDLMHGALHALYLLNRREMEIDPESVQAIRELTPRGVRGFFQGGTADQQRRRALYVFSPFRVGEGRRSFRVVAEIGAELELWPKVFRGLAVVVRDGARWERTLARLEFAHAHAERVRLAQGQGSVGWARVFAVAALLSDLSPSELEHAMAGLPGLLEEVPRGSTTLVSRRLLREGYRYFHAAQPGELAARPISELPAWARPAAPPRRLSLPARPAFLSRR
ncbi:MAG: hypothetical protein IT371_04520 [Deltaproteobacteria bacterium]|nr:hypothetical protein [Deltaproteobacteria bacterium]